jgi:hypothetical protein
MSVPGLPGPSTQELGPRFNLVSLLPSSAVVLFVLLLVQSGAASGRPNLSRLAPSAMVEQGQFLSNLAYLSIAVIAIAFILYPFQIALIRFFEGYWGDSRIARAISGIGREIQWRRREALDVELKRSIASATQRDPQAASPQVSGGRPHGVRAQLGTYPDAARLLPTRLGNVLRAAEDRAGQRYALDTVIIWPRLYPHVTGPLAQALAETRDQLDGNVRLCVALLLATVVSAAMLLTDGPWLLISAGTAVLSWVAYRAAVSTALKYGQAIHVAFDAHRFDMLRGLHYPLPPTLQEELAFNKDLVLFFKDDRPIRGDDAKHRYQHEAEAPVVTEDQATRQGGLLQAFVELWRRRRRR